jgi:hypothetical protein
VLRPVVIVGAPVSVELEQLELVIEGPSTQTWPRRDKKKNSDTRTKILIKNVNFSIAAVDLLQNRYKDRNTNVTVSLYSV